MSLSLWNDEQERPIQHLRIIDLTVMLPGPYVTRLLAQYGADVIKVEQLPKGDPVRELKDTALFELLNAGKRSLAIDIKKTEGAELVKALAGEADVFIENFREGVMDKLGLGYADLSEENPDLLYVSLRGLSGKQSVHAAHDLNFIAASGCGEWFLETMDPNYSANFGDLIGGAFVPLTKLLFHLGNPARRGMHLVSSMDEGFRALYLPRAFDTFKAESVAEDRRSTFGIHRILDGSRPHSRYYRCRDSHWISLNAIQKKHWDTFCDVVDRADWKERMEDPLLAPEVEKLFLDAPSTYWEALASNREICLFRVVPWSEHISFSQARGQLGTDPMTWAGFAANPALLTAPLLGRDTFSILHALGATNKEIADKLQEGLVYQPEKGK